MAKDKDDFIPIISAQAEYVSAVVPVLIDSFCKLIRGTMLDDDEQALLGISLRKCGFNVAVCKEVLDMYGLKDTDTEAQMRKKIRGKLDKTLGKLFEDEEREEANA